MRIASVLILLLVVMVGFAPTHGEHPRRRIVARVHYLRRMTMLRAGVSYYPIDLHYSQTPRRHFSSFRAAYIGRRKENEGGYALLYYIKFPLTCQ